MTDYTAARTAMVDCQVRPSDVTKYPIIEALLSVPREEYVPAGLKSVAYAGEHIALAADRVLLDARTFAKMLDVANVQPTDLILDIGCGLGYSSAILARLAEVVVGVESDKAMAESASERLSDQSEDNVLVVNNDLAAGAAKHGPYDVIFVQGAIEVVPDGLLDQLKEGGRIIAILEEDNCGHCRVGLKSDGNVAWRYAFDASAPILPGFERSAEFAF